MEFEFAKYTEITEFAMKHNPDYKASGYERIFICPDVHDIWLVRILKGSRYEEDEGYVEDENNYILERDKIERDNRNSSLSLSKVRRIVEEDGFDNWDLIQGDDIEELIDNLDDGFGILNRKEV